MVCLCNFRRLAKANILQLIFPTMILDAKLMTEGTSFFTELIEQNIDDMGLLRDILNQCPVLFNLAKEEPSGEFLSSISNFICALSEYFIPLLRKVSFFILVYIRNANWQLNFLNLCSVWEHQRTKL